LWSWHRPALGGIDAPAGASGIDTRLAVDGIRGLAAPMVSGVGDDVWAQQRADEFKASPLSADSEAG